MSFIWILQLRQLTNLRFESSGLAAAYRLKAAGVAVTVFETQNAVGGKIQSFSQNGLIWEKGPNTMAENDPEVTFLIDDLQLREQQQFVHYRHLLDLVTLHEVLLVFV
jgi:protoporphyrinogen oxidase